MCLASQPLVLTLSHHKAWHHRIKSPITAIYSVFREISICETMRTNGKKRKSLFWDQKLILKRPFTRAIFGLSLWTWRSAKNITKNSNKTVLNHSLSWEWSFGIPVKKWPILPSIRVWPFFHDEFCLFYRPPEKSIKVLQKRHWSVLILLFMVFILKKERS